MVGTDWSNVTHAGAFILGVGFGVIITVRVARIVAAFLGDVRRKHDE